MFLKTLRNSSGCPWGWLMPSPLDVLTSIDRVFIKLHELVGLFTITNHNYTKILESDWSSTGLISAVIGQLHTSCACNWTVVRVMPE